MKGLDISGENLEDLLAYDDLFLDYFNAFLSLPVFPQALGYNRLTGAFEEVDVTDLQSSLSGYVSPSVHYGATTAECEKMLKWAREERLPLFLRTQVFRELKLCKLLLRPLDDRVTTSRNSSRELRGYSRQSESYVSSLSNSADNSAEDVLDDEFGFQDLRHSALYRYRRPGSRALSDPAGRVYYDMGDGYSDVSDTGSTASVNKTAPPVPYRHTSTGVHKERGTHTARESASQGTVSPYKKRGARVSSEVEVFPIGPKRGARTHSSKRQPYSSTEEAFLRGARALSAPINYEEFLKMPYMNDFDTLFGETEPEPVGESYVEFEDDRSDDEKTETDVRNMEGRLKMSLQQMKEQVLGTLTGMEAFKTFLQGTAGLSLLNFWLDCEYYKDSTEDVEDDSSVEARNRLFRDIQDKYKLNLTSDARDQISKSASEVGLSHTIFLRTQYDVLRRIRAYWVPRFLLHCEMEPYSHDQPTSMWSMKKVTPKNQVPFFPSISLVRSMPLRPDDALSSSLTSSWDSVTKGNNSRDVMTAQGRRPSSFALHNGSTKERFLLALTADRVAGGPFQRYLEMNGEQVLLSNLLFWEDVTEYGATEDKSADRLLRLQHAWAIFTKYLAHDSPYYVGVPDSIRDRLHQSLLEARDFVEASIYDSAKYQAVDRLEKAWIRFLKEDLKTFLDCRVRPGADSPPSTADAIEITLTDTEIIIKRPRPWVRRVPGSTASERARRLQRALTLAEDIDSERRALNKKLRMERRKEMEKERRKAVKAAYARQREAKFRKGNLKDGEGREGGEDGEGGDGMEAVPTFKDMHANRQMMAMFRKHLQDSDNKELAHYPHLYNDIDSYFDLKDNKQKKDSHATHIYKAYLDPNSKKFAPLPEKISQKVSGEKDRPKTATLKEVQRHVQHTLEDIFKEFILYQADEFGVDPRELANMSQAELTMRMGGETDATWKKKHKGKEAEEGKTEDKDKDKSTKIREITLESIKVRVFEGNQRQSSQRVNVQKREAKTSSHKSKSVRVKVSREGTESALRDTLQSSASSSQETRIETPSSSLLAARRARRAPKATGRAQPSREDKQEFLRALSDCASGHLTIPMLYFYKYLVKHGPEDGMPLIDKDLFFYIEIQKFKDCNHAHTNDELLHDKVQSIIECFLESVTAPSLQVDITPETHSKTTKATARYLQGKDTGPSIFDEAQLQVFRELLPYWAGFLKSFGGDDNKKKPKTKYQKLVEKRMDSIQNYQIPPSNFTLPPIPEGAVPAFTITLSEGVKFKDTEENTSTLVTPMPTDRASKLGGGGGGGGEKTRGVSRAKLTSAGTLSTGPSFLR